MNKQLLMAILVVSLIPAFFSIGRGISGMVVNDTAASAPSASSGGSAMVNVYFFIAFLMLIAAITYLVMLSKASKSSAKVHAKEHKINAHSKSAFEAKSSAFQGKLGHNLKSAFGKFKMNDEYAERYIVAIVGIVGVVAILMMLLR